jgi:serine/threonine-protein kinase
MLLDFGAVKELGTSLDTRIGVEGYSAPEQYRGKPCPQSDIYGVGTTIIFLLTGKTPMQYFRYQSNKYEFDVASIPNLTPTLSQLLEKACQPDYRDRYQTAQSLSEALADCLQSL